MQRGVGLFLGGDFLVSSLLYIFIETAAAAVALRLGYCSAVAVVSISMEKSGKQLDNVEKGHDGRLDTKESRPGSRTIDTHSQTCPLSMQNEELQKLYQTNRAGISKFILMRVRNSFSEKIQDTTFVSTNMNVMQRYYIAGIDMYVGVTLLDQHRNVCVSSMRVHTVWIR
jgi:hypothetical protein